MKLFAILDIKSGFFDRPFSESTSVQALRGWDVAVNQTGTTYNKFPDDFALMELGTFDSQTGTVSPHQIPLNLGSGRTVFRHQESQFEIPLQKQQRPSSEVRAQQ